MALKELLFWEKYRPNTINPEKGKIPIILLPRIKKLVEGGIQMNMLFYGSGGIGKTSISKILAENTDFRKIKATERGVDTIDVIEEHCKNYSLPLRKGNKGNRKGQKVVWLEEFDQTTPDFRKALRSLMEDERYLSVRFIATANNIVKLQRTVEEKALIGRFNLVNFDPETKEEVNYLKDKYLGYLRAISKNVKLELNDEVLNKIINRTFPNLRKAVQLIQEIHITGDFDTYLKQKDTMNSDVFSFILDTENSVSENYFFVMDNYPKEKTEDLLVLLSRSFFKHLINERPEIILKNGFKILAHMKEYNAEYTSTSDPETHLVSFITKLKELVK